jgi:hypothetical protein
MSFWTDLRDTVESVGVLAGNYLLPGSALITSKLVSKGSQEQLNSSLGKIAQLGTGGAAFLEGGPGFSNYSAAYDKLTGALNLSSGSSVSGQQALDAFNSGKLSADEFAALAAGDAAAGGGLGTAVTGGATTGLSKYLVPAAILGSSIIGAGAAKTAATTQADASAQANQLLYQMYKEQQGLQEPFRQAGLTAQNKLMDVLGLSKNTTAPGYGSATGTFKMEGFDPASLMKDFSAADFTADPGYAFRLSEGQKALERSAAARGGLLSGTTGKNLLRYGQEMGSQEFGNAFNRFNVNRAAKSGEYANAFNRYQTERANLLNPLQSLAGVGQSATNTLTGAASNYGTSAGANITGAGAATAAGQVGQANAINNALSSYLNYSSNADLADAVRRSAYR